MSEYSLVLLNCHHCNYHWEYKGLNNYYATCPRCRYKVKIHEKLANVLHKKKLDQDLKSNISHETKPTKLLGIAGIVNQVTKAQQYDKTMLIQNLLDLQSRFGWLPMEILVEVSKQLEITINQVYHAATFYKAFSSAPRGKHLIKVCSGTSCKVRGASVLLDSVQNFLGIKPGETTLDGIYSLETVNCVGCCSLGPVISIDNESHGKINVTNVKKILSRYN